MIMDAIDPFEVMETKNPYGSLIYTPLWAMQYKYNNEVVDVAWCRVHSTNSDFADYTVRIRVNREIVDNYRNKHLFDTANTLRKHEVRNQLLSEREVSTFGETFFKKEDIADATEKLWKRAGSGEFVGQFNSTMIYVQEIAEILNLEMPKVLKVIDEIMIPQKRIGLNGMILTSWESQEEARISLERSTGHKNLSMSDFGYWGCSACGKHGDDYENPKDYSCVKST